MLSINHTHSVTLHLCPHQSSDLSHLPHHPPPTHLRASSEKYAKHSPILFHALNKRKTCATIAGNQKREARGKNSRGQAFVLCLRGGTWEKVVRLPDPQWIREPG